MLSWSDMLKKKIIKGIVFLAVSAIVLSRLPAADSTAPETSKASSKLDDLFPDTVVAKGKGIEIKRSEVEDAIMGTKAQYAGRLTPDDVTRLEQQGLESLIQVKMLANKATDEDRTTAKDVISKKLDEYKTNSIAEQGLERQLKIMGTTLDQLRNKYIEQYTAQLVMERELKINVTDADIKKFYDDNPAKFEQPERVRVSHILLSTKDPTDTNPDPTARKDLSDEGKKAKHKQAEDVLKRARAGEDFTKLAKDFSDDPGVKQNNGEYVFSRDDPFVPEFKRAAFALSVNQVSDIVTTAFGYHIIKLSEKIPAKKVELAQVAPRVKEYLKNEQLKPKQKEAKEFLEKLRKDADVQVLDEKLKIKETPDASAPASQPPAESEKAPKK